MTDSWFWLHEEQCCDRDGCKRPVHIDGLCGLCFAGAEPAERAAALFFRAIYKPTLPPPTWRGWVKAEEPQLPWLPALIVQFVENLR